MGSLQTELMLCLSQLRTFIGTLSSRVIEPSAGHIVRLSECMFSPKTVVKV